MANLHTLLRSKIGKALGPLESVHLHRKLPTEGSGGAVIGPGGGWGRGAVAGQRVDATQPFLHPHMFNKKMKPTLIERGGEISRSGFKVRD